MCFFFVFGVLGSGVLVSRDFEILGFRGVAGFRV